MKIYHHALILNTIKWLMDDHHLQCEALKAEGAKVASSAADVVRGCDITFAMLADPQAALQVATASDGVAAGVKAAKAAGRCPLYVDVSTVDAETAIEIARLVTDSGGRYVEVPLPLPLLPALHNCFLLLMGMDVLSSASTALVSPTCAALTCGS
jgi:hypothetical protein